MSGADLTASIVSNVVNLCSEQYQIDVDGHFAEYVIKATSIPLVDARSGLLSPELVNELIEKSIHRLVHPSTMMDTLRMQFAFEGAASEFLRSHIIRERTEQRLMIPHQLALAEEMDAETFLKGANNFCSESLGNRFHTGSMPLGACKYVEEDGDVFFRNWVNEEYEVKKEWIIRILNLLVAGILWDRAVDFAQENDTKSPDSAGVWDAEFPVFQLKERLQDYISTSVSQTQVSSLIIRYLPDEERSNIDLEELVSQHNFETEYVCLLQALESEYVSDIFPSFSIIHDAFQNGWNRLIDDLNIHHILKEQGWIEKWRNTLSDLGSLFLQGCDVASQAKLFFDVRVRTLMAFHSIERPHNMFEAISPDWIHLAEDVVSRLESSVVVENWRLLRISREQLDDNQATVQLHGFCPSSAAQFGCAVVGNSDIGLIEYLGSYYSFADIFQVDVFERDVNSVLVQLRSQCGSHPELLRMMDVVELLPRSILVGTTPKSDEAISATSLLGRKVDVGVETPTHFVESFIDPNYEFNEWTMRKKALQLADLRTKRTRSMQTHISHFRRDNTSQTWLPKDASQQTLKETSMNTMKTVRYVSGLRGDPKAPMNVINLTFDL